MITTLHDPVVTTDEGGTLRLSASLTFAPGTLPPASVSSWVYPAESAVADASVVPFVPPALVLACRLGQDLQVDEALPPAMHAGARHVASLLHGWYGWRPAELIAPVGPDSTRPDWMRRRRGRGVFFTRGVDSWGTLFDLLDRPKRGRPTHLVTVDNEVHIAREIRDAHLAETQRVADRLGLPLITVGTDLRSVLDPHTDWGTDTHGSVLAGIGLLLRSTLSEVVISPTHWTPLLRPWGSHPELDPAWSLPGCRIVHHPGDESRGQRIVRIMEEPIAAETILVCWQGTSERNCGKCEKCLRLMTVLAANGILDQHAGRFDVPFDPTAIGAGLTVSPHPWCELIDYLDGVGLDADSLRQRWEQVERHGRPAIWFQTRPVQPRIPVWSPGDATTSERRRSEAARHLATRGIRVDWTKASTGAAGTGLEVVDAPGPTRVLVHVDGTAAPSERDLASLALGDLESVLSALGLDVDDAVPYDPDGQEPPDYVPEPAYWTAEGDHG